MKHFLLPLALLLTCLPAQAGIFNLDDDTLDIIPAQPEKPASIPAKPAPAPTPLVVQPEPPKPAPAPSPAPVPAVPAIPPPAPKPQAPPPPAATEAQKTSPFTAQFPLYQSAHAAYLRKDYKAAFPAFGRLLALAKKQEAESPFTLRARLLREHMRLEAGDASDKAQAVRNLAKFTENTQAGPFRLDALLLLVKERMDAGDPRGAKPWVEKLSRAVAEERGTEDPRKAEQTAFLAELTPEIQSKIAPHASPWQAYPDIFGHIARRAEIPGQVVHAACAPWHLNDIETQAAQAAGLVAFLGGDRMAAKKAWARAAQIAPAPPGGAGHRGAGKKFAFAAKSGRLLAYAGEERLFDSIPKVGERVAMAEYLFLGEEASDLAQAEAILRAVIAADAVEKAKMNEQIKAQEENIRQSRGVVLVEKIKWRGLSDVQSDYVKTTLATLLHREGKSQEALAHFEAVFARISHNQVERRTVIAYGNAARLGGTDAQRRRAEELEKALVASPLDDPWAKLARLNRAMRLEEAGHKPEALTIWRRFDSGGGAFGKYARTMLPKQREK